MIGSMPRRGDLGGTRFGTNRSEDPLSALR